MDDLLYKLGDKTYPVHIVYKRIKNVYYRFIDGEFYISSPRFVFKNRLLKGLDKYAESLISKSLKNKQKEEDKTYFMGEIFSNIENGEYHLNNGDIIIFINKEDKEKKLKKYFYNYVYYRSKELADLMNVSFNKVQVKNMKSRYGSYSKKTKNIHLSYTLMSYSRDIIDSVIIHELSHIIVFNHSKSFYEVVYKYCPNYDKLTKKLNRGEIA